MYTYSLMILTIRITVHSIAHTNIGSTSVDGITVLMMMIMVDTGRLVWATSCVGKKDKVEVNMTGHALPACKTWHGS